jgi:hypothetical protein
MRNVLTSSIVAAALLSLATVTAAQNQPLAFEAASVKPVGGEFQIRRAVSI